MNFWLELRHSLRYLLSKRAFSTAAILTLAIGIGANTAVFSALYAVVLRPLPFMQPEQLVVLSETIEGRKMTVSYPNFVDWKEAASSFSSFSGFAPYWVALRHQENVVPLVAVHVDAYFFRTLGVQPQLGRTFSPSEDKAGVRSIVLSDKVWRSSFGSDPQLLGKTVLLGGKPATVVGIMPPGFAFPKSADCWLPLGLLVRQPPRAGSGATNFLDRNNRMQLEVLGRLKPGVKFSEANAEMQGIRDRLAKLYPRENRELGISLQPLSEYAAGSTAASLKLLTVAVALLLLLACTNVANLVASQLLTRSREFAVRAALGATRLQIAAKLVMEGALLTLGGLGTGLFLASGLGALLVATVPAIQKSGMSWEWPVVAFAAAVCAVCTFTAGAVPALVALGRESADRLPGLKDGQPGVRPGVQRAMAAFVALQMALALVLLCGAATVGGTLLKLQAVQPGFQTESLLTVLTVLDSARYDQPAKRKLFADQVVAKLSANPAVGAAAITASLPLSGLESVGKLERIAGRPLASPFNVDYASVTERYFESMAIPLLAGRFFNERDTATSPQVAIIDQEFARIYFPDVNPIGQRVKFELADGWLEVVGVVGSVRQNSLWERPGPQLYRPYSQDLWDGIALTVRTAVEPQAMATTVTKILLNNDPELRVLVLTGRQLLDRNLTQTRLITTALAVFAGAAAILACVGVYGLVASTTAAQTREIGVRQALGATPAMIVRSVVVKNLLPVLVGLVIGGGLSVLLSTGLQSFVASVQQAEPLVLVTVGVSLLVLSALACWWPARRVATLDPVKALRYE